MNSRRIFLKKVDGLFSELIYGYYNNKYEKGKGCGKICPLSPTDRGLAETPLLRPILQVSLTLKNCALWYRNIFPHLPNNI